MNNSITLGLPLQSTSHMIKFTSRQIKSRCTPLFFSTVNNKNHDTKLDKAKVTGKRVYK